MRNAFLYLLLFAIPFACTPEKHKAASQNNKLVAIHGEVVRAVTELDAAKKDNTKFVQQLENTIKVIKNQSKELNGIPVLSKLADVKGQLEKSLRELEQGYSEVVDLYKNEKLAEAKARLEVVEKAFQGNTQVLQDLQAKVAKEYDIPIAAPPPAVAAPAPAAVAPAADMPADAPVPAPAVDAPTADMPADAPAPAVVAPAADMPADAPAPAPAPSPADMTM
ncbi:hypothetical protein KKD52_06845 [Myxococcota bacterium]|nr:hypothetical protein [Myxococcota bacterium]MBU1413359.1 hypothetical protein [Myxococcota bacterium]MBU1510062.1 hypothetical protein [Myxococcota bacterium]